ncbi:MAG: glucose-1-phosphate adenylyltransferase [Myxococcales bacterium]|nr:glucose-1-phosphate adenylyltransferase [Myxococcales bacterium]
MTGWIHVREREMQTLVMIMAGGKGSRLAPLTCHRAKPAVPFGGRYRIIDFVLSNFVNSGYRHVYVLTQFMASSLIQHLSRNWGLSGFGMFIEAVPAQMRRGAHWYEGTADSVWQNMNLIRDAHCQHVAVFGGDHIYRFAVDQMEAAHIERKADLTIAACPMPAAEASRFGVIEVDETGKITGFQEKPDVPTEMPNRPGWSLVSMGNYIFRTGVLEDVLIEDATLDSSGHDFGKDIIPKMVSDGRPVYIYDFHQNKIPGEGPEDSRYWRDVGTMDSYFDANMDLRAALPEFNLYNRQWPIRSAQRNYPPAKFVRDGGTGRSGELVDSLVCEGTIVSSASMVNVMAGYGCLFEANCQVDESVILSGCTIGQGARLRRVLMDKNCSIAAGTVIGYDKEADRKRFPWMTPNGVVVLPKGTHVPFKGPIELAWDMVSVLENDPHAGPIMRGNRDAYVSAGRGRHSHDSTVPDA